MAGEAFSQDVDVVAAVGIGLPDTDAVNPDATDRRGEAMITTPALMLRARRFF